MFKRQRKIVSVAVVLSLIVTMGSGLIGKPAGAATDYGISNPVTDSNGVTTWDKVKFGSYYQTAEFKPEPIKWRVLSVDGDDAFLLADENLDCKPYNTEEKDVTWETCSLRKWLNEDFYNEAFSDSEQEAIREMAVVNEDNPEYGTAGGNDTTDHIYVLSLDEAGNTKYGFTSLNTRTKTRESNNTDYAKCNYAHSSKDENGHWWLRSPGHHSYHATVVGYNGRVNWDCYGVNYSYIAVRPALHLNLSSSVHVDAGEVDSNGNVTNKEDGISAPVTDSNGVTTWDCVYLGNYGQTAEWEKEPIEWRVLSVDGDDAFLLADENLDGKPYHTESEDVTWETCSLRKWLNEDFYNEAFSDSERAAIRETAVVNEDNPEYGTVGGNGTTDRIYLLSVDEASNAEYGFASESARKSNNTDYAKCNHVAGFGDENARWWLRSPGISSYEASFVLHDGEILAGEGVDNYDNAVRPTLHLNLSSFSWSRSGQVSSDETGEPVPSESPLASESPKASVSPEQTVTIPPLASDLPQMTRAPQMTNLPKMTNAPSVTAIPGSTNPGGSPLASESPKPSSTPVQIATTPSPAVNLPKTETPPQATNAPVATASPVPTSNSADTGKLGKVSIKSAKNSKKNAAVLTWKKVNGASGYQIQYALDQKFAKGKKAKTTAGTGYTLKKLKKKKTYYVRIRAFRKTGSKNLYGAWSKVKKVKIKK